MTYRPTYPKTHATEAGIQAAILDYLTWCGFLILRINQGAMQPESNGKRRFVPFAFWRTVGRKWEQGGVADILAFRAGKFYAFEVKKPSGRPTKLQREFLELWQEKGGIGGIVRSVEDVERIINNGHKL